MDSEAKPAGQAKPIQDLQPGESVTEAVYLLDRKWTGVAGSGSPYLNVRLRDATGQIEAQLWDMPSDAAEVLREGQGVLLTGQVTVAYGRAQINIQTICPYRIDPRDFLPHASRPAATMREQMEAHIASVNNPWLRLLLERVFLRDPDFLTMFLEAPAGKEYHHACLGGLAEHTLDAVGLAEDVARRYPWLDHDLLIAAVLLHDVGKVEANEWRDRLGFSDEGLLLGHIHLGTQRVAHAITEIPDFPRELCTEILHAILAHHGDPKKGSIVQPKTLEALAVHMVDTLDAYVRGFIDHLERERTSDDSWTSWSEMFNTALRRGTRPSAREHLSREIYAPQSCQGTDT